MDPGFVPNGAVDLESVEEGAWASYSCNRPGFKPYPEEKIKCILGKLNIMQGHGGHLNDTALDWQSKHRCFGSHEGNINHSSGEDRRLAGFGVILSLADYVSVALRHLLGLRIKNKMVYCWQYGLKSASHQATSGYKRSPS